MHLLFFAPHLNTAGGSKVIYQLSNELVRHGHEVTVALHKIASNLLWVDTKPPDFEIVKTPFFSKHTLPKADVMIHFGDGETFGPFPNVPQVLYLQGFGTMNPILEHTNLLYPYVGVITTSQWLGEIARRAGHKKVFTVPPGVDSLFFEHKRPKVPQDFTIGCLYHEAPMKNIDFFVAAMQRLTVSTKRFQVLFLASRHPKDKKSLFNGVTFDHSFVVRPPRHLVPFIYSACNVWCSPSLSEGFGLPILEAMAVGTPTVVVPSLGLDEFLKNDYNCKLVENGKKDQLCNAVLGVGKRSQLQDTIVKNGRKLASSFNWPIAAKNFVKSLNSILGK